MSDFQNKSQMYACDWRALKVTMHERLPHYTTFTPLHYDCPIIQRLPHYKWIVNPLIHTMLKNIRHLPHHTIVSQLYVKDLLNH